MAPLLAFVAVGFGASLIDGAVGRAAEVTATTVLLAGQQPGSRGGLALFLGCPEVAG